VVSERFIHGVVCIAGNHDWLFERNQKAAIEALGPGITYLENSGVEIEGLKIWGSPVQPPFMNWAFNVPRGPEIRKYWDKIPVGTDILITHGPPKGILDQSNAALNTEHCGCEELLLALHRVKPPIHVFGHIHGGYGLQDVRHGRDRYEATFCHNVSVVDEAYRVVNKPVVTYWNTEAV
jgi:Icc-related predicted phosphoesterase